MAVKHNNLYLYLTLVCFLGIIVILVFDAYIGIYDRLTVTSGEYPQVIEADQWGEDQRYPYYSQVNVAEGGNVTFKYEVENRHFSDYVTDVEISAWHNQIKVADLMTLELSAGSFATGQLEWVLDMGELVPMDIPENESYEFTVMIKRGDVERNVVLYIPGNAYVSKPLIVPEIAR